VALVAVYHLVVYHNKRFMSILNLIAAVPASSSAILSVGYLPLTFGVLDA